MDRHPQGIMQTMNSDRGIGQGSDLYRGEGSLGTAGEYHNSLAPFLGPPSKRIDAEPNHQFPHEAWFLPDAYGGRNEYIRETIVQMVINYNSFMTREILPWVEQQNPNIAWDSIRFDKTLVDMEPEQGVPRYVTVERESHSDYMVRRGLALIVNHGFASTPGGQKDFMYKVATIAGAVQETCDQAGVVALLRAKNEYRAHALGDMKNANDAYDLFHHELWRWGIIQHTERGWYHMDAEAQHVMRCENIQPDTWIVPPRMTSFAAMGQMAETEVWRAGESVARANLMKGEDNFATFRGKSVFEIKPYQLDVDGRTVDPLNRSRMIGDFFVVPYYDIRRDGDGPMYPVAKGGRTQVYCCESDRFETFGWQDLQQKSQFEKCYDVLSDVLAIDGTQRPGEGKDPRSEAVKFVTALAVAEAIHKHPDVTPSIIKHPDEHFQDHWLHGSTQRDDKAAADKEEARTRAAARPDKPNEHLTKLMDLVKSRVSNAKPAAAPGVSQARAVTPFSTKISDALAIGLRNEFPNLVDVTNPAQAAQSYAKPLCVAGFSAEVASKVMLDQLHAAISHEIRTSAATQDDIIAASAQEVHNAYIQGGSTNSNLSCVMDRVTPSAFKAASASGTNPMYDIFDSQPMVPDDPTRPGPSVDLVGQKLKEFPDDAGDIYIRMIAEGLTKEKVYSQDELATIFKVEQSLPADKKSVVRWFIGNDVLMMGALLMKPLDDLVREQSGEEIDLPTLEEPDPEIDRQPYLNKLIVGNYRDMPGMDVQLNHTVTMYSACAFYRLCKEDGQLSTIVSNMIMPHGAAATDYPGVLDFVARTKLVFFYEFTARETGIVVTGTALDVQARAVLRMANLAYKPNATELEDIFKVRHIGEILTKYKGDDAVSVADPFGVFEGDRLPPNAVYDILCFRPFRRYTMGTGVLCKKGSDLGNTFRGWADFQLTDNIIAKTHIGHFTFWHASVVTNAKCLFLAEDIFCTNYEGGEGKKVLSWAYARDFHDDPMSTMSTHNASIICVPVPVGAINPIDKRLELNNPISLTGSLDPIMRASTGHHTACEVHMGDYANEGKTKNALESMRKMWDAKVLHLKKGDPGAITDFEKSYPMPVEPNASPYWKGQLMSDIVNQIFRFNTLNHEVDYTEAKTFETSGRLINTICFHTMQKFQNPSNLRWEVTNLNTGHFGEDGIYEGVKKIRCGFLDYFKNMEYAKAMAMGGLNI